MDGWSWDGCFDINSRINMADGSTKQIKDLKMNDLVMTLTYDGDYSMSKVVCIVETNHSFLDLLFV